MFNVKAEPIANEPPYRRIGINDPLPIDLSGRTALDDLNEAIEWGKNRHVWQAVIDTASGTNISTSSPSSTGSHTDCDNTVCTDGWEAG